MIHLEMGDCNTVLLEKQQKHQHYECLTSKEILTSNQSQMIEKAKLTDSPLKKAYEKQTKTA